MKKVVLSMLVIFLVSISTVAFGQKGNLHGYVKESATGDAMIGASVFIQGTSTGTVTDFNGEFTLIGINAGEITVEFTYLGFHPITKVITITGGTQEIEILMDYEAISLIEGEVVVTAQASAQMAAINKQLSSKTIANVISSKRIQELPDANAAEVVGRLPGVSLVRQGGEGAKVVIRGLDPKYSNVTLEGVKMASTGANDRSTDMSMISPFMLEGIEVSKAALPDKEADAHGGTINFVLKEAPKEFKLDAFVSRGFNSVNSTANSSNYKVVIGASNRFFNNKLGLFVQGDFENRNRSSHSLYAIYVPIEPGLIDSEIRSSVIALTDVYRKINRKGGAIVLDYKLKNGSIKFSNFGSSIGKDFLNRGESYGMQYDRHNYQFEQTNTNLLVATNALSISKTFGPIKVNLRASRAYSRDETPESLTLTAVEDGGSFLVKQDADGNDVTVNYNGSVKEIVSFAKYDYNAARLERIALNDSRTETEIRSYGGDIEYFLNLSKNISMSVKAGGKYKKLNKDYDLNSKNIPISWGQHGAPLRSAIANNYDGVEPGSTISYAYFVDNDYVNSDFLKGEYTLKSSFRVKDANTIAELAKEGDLYLNHFPTSIRSDYSGHEEYTAGFLMFDFNLFKTVTFTPGFRYEENKTTYTAIRGSELPLNEYVGYRHSAVTTTRKNDFFLPMFHLKYTPLEWLNVRMAYTNTLARPDFSQITPSSNIQTFSVAWNNPYLEPSKSENIDIYISGYKSKMGLFSVGAFQKKISNLIFNAGLSHIHNPEDYGLTAAEAGKTITRIVNNKLPIRLWGVEAEYKTRFWYMDNFLKGVVLNLNYTHIFSEAKYPITQIESEFSSEPPYIVTTNIDTFFTAPMLNQPNDIFNATIGYDYEGFSARVSYLYRTKIFSRVEYWTGLRASSLAYSRWDVSLKQKLPKGFSVMLNLANIFSQREQVQLINSGLSVDEQYYGSTIDLGLRYRF